MLETILTINTQSPYGWKEDYWPLYRDLNETRKERELTNDERKILEWLSYGFTQYLFRGMQ